MKISSKKLAEVLGVPAIEIPRLMHAGMPSEGNRFRAVHCLLWFVRHQRNLLDRSSTVIDDADRDALHTERQRLVKAQADRSETELKEVTKTYLEVDTLTRIFGEQLGTVKSLILGIPSRYTHRLAGSSEAEVSKILFDAAEQILRNLRPSVETLREEPSKVKTGD